MDNNSSEHTTDVCNSSVCLTEKFRSEVLPVTIFIGVLILLGIVGNAIVLFVYGFRYTKNTYCCFVLYLGFIDIVSCITTMPAEIVSHMFWFSYDFQAICEAKSFFNVFTVSADVLVLVAIAIDRRIQISFPQKTQYTPDFARQIIAGITLAAGGIAAPAVVVGGVNHFTYTDSDGEQFNVSMCGVEDKFQDVGFETIYVICLQIINGISLCSMFILYIVIGIAWNKGKGDERERLFQDTDPDSLNNRTKIRRQTLSLLFLTIFFIVTTVLYLILDSFIEMNVETYNFHQIVLFLLFFRLYFVNHAINPFIYGWLDVEFRVALKSVFKCTRNKDR